MAQLMYYLIINSYHDCSVEIILICEWIIKFNILLFLNIRLSQVLRSKNYYLQILLSMIHKCQTQIDCRDCQSQDLLKAWCDCFVIYLYVNLRDLTYSFLNCASNI